MHDKKKIIIIGLVLFICVIGISWYAKDFNKKDNKKQITTKVDNKIINITDKTSAVKIASDKIKTSDIVNDMYDILGASHLTIEHSEKTFLIYNEDKKKQIVKELPEDSDIIKVKTYKNHIIFIEKDIEKHNKDDEPFEINTLYVYDTANKSLTKVKGSNLAKELDGKEYITNYIQLHDGNLFYCLYSSNSDCLCNSIVFMYNLDNKQEKQIYTLKPTKEDNEGIISFDVDIEKGYLVCQESDNSTEQLVLIDLKKNSKKTLARTQGMFSLELSYPNIAFTLNNDIHVYNIEKNDDDLCFKCDDTPMAGIVFKDKKLVFCTKEIYCYSMKEKKLYDIDKAESEIASNDDYVYYNKNGKVNYIKIDDIR